MQIPSRPIPAAIAAALSAPISPNTKPAKKLDPYHGTTYDRASGRNVLTSPIRLRARDLLSDKYQRAGLIGPELETISTTGKPLILAGCAPVTRLRRAVEPGALIATESDGSLGEHGVEFIEVLPRAPELWAGEIGAQWALMMRQIAASGGVSWNDARCGVHINLSTASQQIPREQIAFRMSHLLTEIAVAGTGNAPDERGECLATIAGRVPSPRYCVFPYSAADTRDKYRTVSSEKAERVEVRAWRGTLNPVAFLGATLLSHLVMHHAGVLAYRIAERGEASAAALTLETAYTLLAEVCREARASRPNAYNLMFALLHARCPRALAYGLNTYQGRASYAANGVAASVEE